MRELMGTEQTISSLEVAELMEKEHGKLLRDIRRYSQQLDEAKFGFIDFWKESIYIDERNRNKPCYMITKKGCEFIAHKTTGAKGTVFTARYINRFHEMEQEIAKKKSKPIEQKQPEFRPPVPLKRRNESTWYEEYKLELIDLIKWFQCSRQELYHDILEYVGIKYDLEKANTLYAVYNGHKPQYAMDIIEYFPELRERASKYVRVMHATMKDKKERHSG